MMKARGSRRLRDESDRCSGRVFWLHSAWWISRLLFVLTKSIFVILRLHLLYSELSFVLAFAFWITQCRC